MKKNILLKYTILFSITSVLVYILFILYGRTFIYEDTNYAGDGIVQHYNALVYYGKWLRTICKNIFIDHKFSIPTWDTSIGLGGDVIATLNFYVIGDPLNIIAVFVPEQFTEILYNILVIVRLYLAGLTFIIYCSHHGYGENNILCGTLIYVFSFYSIVVSVLHPFFINPLIYFPLILLGIDYILERKNVIVYMLSCALAAASNFYFFYMLSVFMVIYAIIRYVGMYGKTKPISFLLKTIGTCILFYLLALGIAAPLLIPSAHAVINGDRLNGDVYVPLLYEPGYYVKLGIAFVNASADYYSALGYTSVGLLAVVFLYFKTRFRDKMPLKIAFAIGTLFLMFPFFGHVLNGFSYVTNRWVWAYCFIVSLVVLEMLPDLLKNRFFLWSALAAMAVFAAPTFYMRSGGNMKHLAVGIVLLITALCISVCLTLFFSKRNKPIYALLGIVIVSLSLNAYSFYSPLQGNDIGKHQKPGEAYAKRQTQFYRLMDMSEDKMSQFRVDTVNMGFDGVGMNSAMLNNVNGTAFYYSVSNPYTLKFLRDMELPITSDYMYVDMDGRSMVEAITGCRYAAVRVGEEAYLPYGYDYRYASDGDYSIYFNKNADLSLVYVYDSYISYTDYSGLSSAKKQQALLQSCVLYDSDIRELDEYAHNAAGDAPSVRRADSLDFYDSVSEYEVVLADSSIEMGQNEFKVTEPGASITVSAESAENAERYFEFTNLQFTGDSLSLAKISISDGIITKGFQIRGKNDNAYSGISNIICNMGYSKSHGTEYTIMFETPGIYTYDSISIIDQSMEAFDSMLQNITAGPQQISLESCEDGYTIHSSLMSDKILYLAIPYSSGWSARLDGETIPCMPADNFGMAVYVPAGGHTVEFEYHTPYLR